jgi:glycosyltransferase involved in cell wall biosynthesis
MKTIAAIPAYNEEATIGSVVLRARKYVDQVIVVDDGDEIEYDAYVHNYEKILF